MFNGLLGYRDARKKALEQQAENAVAHREKVLREIAKAEADYNRQHGFLNLEYRPQIPLDRAQLMRDAQAAERAHFERQREIMEKGLLDPRSPVIIKDRYEVGFGNCEFPLTPEQCFAEEDISSEECDHIEI